MVTKAAGGETMVYVVSSFRPVAAPSVVLGRVDMVVVPAKGSDVSGVMLTFKGPQVAVDALTEEIGNIACSTSTSPPPP